MNFFIKLNRNFRDKKSIKIVLKVHIIYIQLINNKSKILKIVFNLKN